MSTSYDGAAALQSFFYAIVHVRGHP